MGTYVCGHKHVWEQTCVPPCVGTNVCETCVCNFHLYTQNRPLEEIIEQKLPLNSINQGDGTLTPVFIDNYIAIT